MTAHEAIAWMRICRPGSVIGHQQDWLEQLEAWLLKQGNSYRKRLYGDTNRLPTHEFGIYSIAEKINKQKPVVFSKSPSPSPPPPLQRPSVRSETSPPARPQASKTRDEKHENEDEEVFITSCDLTLKPIEPQTQLKGCVIKNSTISENDEVTNKTPEKKFDWNVKVNSPKNTQKGDQPATALRRGSGAGEPRGSRNLSRCTTPKIQAKNSTKTIDSSKNTTYGPMPTFRTSEGPLIKNVADAKNFLMRSSLCSEQKKQHLSSAITVTPQYSYRFSKLENEKPYANVINKPTSSATASKYSSQFRRRLGRSPSPLPIRYTEQSRATNTPTPSTDKFLARDSKAALQEALSRLKLSRALRPLKSFNIENRAHRVISKEKPKVAPKYPSTFEDLQRVQEAVPDIDDKLDKKNQDLDQRLKDVYVTSTGIPEDDITRKKKDENPDRPLPNDRKPLEDFDFGLKEPEKITYGRTTLRKSLEYISSHQMNPDEATPAKIAFEYKLKEKDVENILKYFKTFEIYIPETKNTNAVFAGPLTERKKLMEHSVGKIEAKKDVKVKKKEKGACNFYIGPFCYVVAGPRDGSIGAASLGARRDAPAVRRAPSVRSDERPTATQGDMLNSIKFQRRFREIDKPSMHDKVLTKERPSIRVVNSRTSTMANRGTTHEMSSMGRSSSPTRSFLSPRPASPRGRRQMSNFDKS
ncbi:unnamed protein product [Leptosia nina]|uniref:Uncharacterized protein n=1 Tax=Leptosia nina TaxID=320188 RepID=A0AAV1J307_9NEOP